MPALWKKWWIRLIIGIVMTPFVMTIAAIAAGFVFAVATFHFNELKPNLLFPGVEVWLPMALIELASAIPIWIGLEVSNRSRRRPLPPGIAALFLAAFAFMFVLSIQLNGRFGYSAIPWQSIPVWIQAGVMYFVAVGLAVLVVQPLIRRWLKKVRAEQDASLVF